jgi:hypothetical protein
MRRVLARVHDRDGIFTFGRRCCRDSEYLSRLREWADGNLQMSDDLWDDHQSTA